MARYLEFLYCRLTYGYRYKEYGLNRCFEVELCSEVINREEGDTFVSRREIEEF